MKRTGNSKKTNKQYTYYCCEFVPSGLVKVHSGYPGQAKNRPNRPLLITICLPQRSQTNSGVCGRLGGFLPKRCGWPVKLTCAGRSAAVSGCRQKKPAAKAFSPRGESGRPAQIFFSQAAGKAAKLLGCLLRPVQLPQRHPPTIVQRDNRRYPRRLHPKINRRCPLASNICQKVVLPPPEDGVVERQPAN